MGGPNPKAKQTDPAVDHRLSTIEAQQQDTATKQKEIEDALAAQQKNFAATLDVLQDNNEAMIHLQKYSIHFLLEAMEQGLMVSSAVTKFAGFLNLPPSSSSINQYLDLAFTAVSALYPALRLSKILDTVSKDADVALTIAKATDTSPPVAAVVLKGLSSDAGQIADVLKKGNDTRMKALAAMKSDPSSGAVTELSKLDASKGPIKDLIATANQAGATFDKVADMISAEFKKRVVNPNATQTESILQKTKKVLTPPDFPTEAELDQLETQYLWQMVTAYCKNKKNNVVYIKSDMPNLSPLFPTRIPGLNNTQIDALVDLFGWGAARGKYFMIPFYSSGYDYLDFIGIPTIIEKAPPGMHRF